MSTMEIGCSFSTGKEAYAHDVRKTIKGNVTTELIKDNVILRDVLQGQSVDKYIDNLLQPDIDAYNEKQKQKCRRIETGYCEWHRNNKTLKKSKLVYEAVAQFGEHENLGKKYYESQGAEREQLQKYYTEQYTKVLEDFEKNYPHLKVLWCVVHMDEERGTPHMHLAFTPIGEFEKQGLAHKVSIGRALEQDGIQRVKDRKEAKVTGGYQLTKLYRAVRQSMEQDLIRQGYTIKQEQHGKKHQTVEEWEATQELKQERKQEEKKLEQVKKETVAYIDFGKELQDIQEAANRPAYDVKKIEKVQVKDGAFKKKEVIQMDEQTFREMQSTADTKAIQREVEYKIAKQQKATEKLVQSLTTEKEEQLQDQIQELRQELSHAQRIIKDLQKKLKSAKEFLHQFNLIEKYKIWKQGGTDNLEQVEEFYFEGKNRED